MTSLEDRSKMAADSALTPRITAAIAQVCVEILAQAPPGPAVRLEERLPVLARRAYAQGVLGNPAGEVFRIQWAISTIPDGPADSYTEDQTLTDDEIIDAVRKVITGIAGG